MRVKFDLKLLIGDEHNIGWLPTKLTSATYEILSNRCDDMKEYYECDNDDCYVLKAGRWVIIFHYNIRHKIKMASTMIEDEIKKKIIYYSNFINNFHCFHFYRNIFCLFLFFYFLYFILFQFFMIIIWFHVVVWFKFNYFMSLEKRDIRKYIYIYIYTKWGNNNDTIWKIIF